MSNKTTKEKLTKTLINQIPINFPVIDSFSLKIKLSDIQIIDERIISEVCYYYPNLNAFDDEMHSPKPLVIKENGITIRINIIEIPIYNKQTYERVQTRFINITVTSKLLRQNYFQGINKETIRILYDEFINFNVFYCDYETFMNGIVSDVDICINRYIETPKLFVDCLETLILQTGNKKKFTHLIVTSSNIGISFNTRNYARPSVPFIKLYHKELELLSKSSEFYNKYIVKDYGYAIKNLTRIECTIKDYNHKQRLEKFGIMPHFKTLDELMRVGEEDMYKFIVFSVNSYLEKVVRKNPPELSPNEHIIFELLQNCVLSGYDFKTLLTIADTYTANSKESMAVGKTRIRKKVTELYDLLVHKEEKLQKKSRNNELVNKYLNFLKQ